jgi:hypothetical protein
MESGNKLTMHLCSSCLKRIRKDETALKTAVATA